jgi:3-hydroxyacyl-CoA dehydrogenase
MLSRPKPLAALAAVTAAIAVAVPVASASAATTAGPTVDPQVCQNLNTAMGPFGLAQFIGDASLANVIANAAASVDCPPPAAQPSLLPTVP